MLKNISLKDFKISRLKYQVDQKASIRDTLFFDDKLIFYYNDGSSPDEFSFPGGVCKAFQKGSVTILLNRTSETTFVLYAYQYKKPVKNSGNIGFSLYADSYVVSLFETDGFIGVFDILVSYEFSEIEYSKAHGEYVKIMKSVYNSANDVMQVKMFF